MICGRDDLVEPGRSVGGQPHAGNEAHVDHIIAQANGGDGAPSNGQVTCERCNLDKGRK
jgi:5-methylcytosine-specific restriction endonuclease McrA